MEDLLMVSFAGGYEEDPSAICVTRKTGDHIEVLKMELEEQADILYHLLTEQMTKAEIKKGITVGVKHDILTKDDIKDIDPEDDVFVAAAENLKQTISLVKEDQEKFIFNCITPFLAEINEIVIPKRVLERALTTFKEEHTAEWKVLMKEYGGTL